jgi:predicted regulator of Ras-like GTPase activity (Roadblock/LC7/MglB family)
MLNKLNALLERLKAHQRDLILAMAGYDGLPAGSALRQAAELENVIAAVEAVAAEEADRAKQS